MKNEDFELIEITNISREDAQGIIDSLPNAIKKQNASTRKFDKDPTILSLLAGNLKKLNFRFIDDFYEKDEVSAELFLMICYVHSCGVPCSFDTIYSYIGDEELNWEGIMKAIDKVGGLIDECSEEFVNYEVLAQFEDYYQCRSRILAENIISKSAQEKGHLKKVLERFVINVPVYHICNYDKFRRTAYDANLVYKVFTNVQDGENFYMNCSQKDDSEYLFQQAALYLKKYKEYKKAFDWIDRARNKAHYNRFTIESTYAQIYFEVNLNVSEEETIKALRILENCCRDDKRKSIHFLAYADCVASYLEIYDNSEFKNKILYTAFEFIDEGLDDSNKSLSKKIKWQLRDAKKRLKAF